MSNVMMEWPEHLRPMNNARMHPMERHRKVQAQRLATGLSLRANRIADRLGQCPAGSRLLVTFVRIAPRKVDPGDNLNSCFKAIRDEIAAYFHVNDGDENFIRFDYAAQLKGPSQVRVLFAFEEFRPVHRAVVSTTQLATTPQEWRRRGMLSSGVVRNRA